MSFLFGKSKKNAPPSQLPNATRNIHTSDGTTPAPIALSEKTSLDTRQTQSPQPGSNANGSMSSMNSVTAPNGNYPRRERAESEAGVSDLIMSILQDTQC
jgi:hypothetical protein